MNRLSETDRVSLHAYLTTKLDAGTLNMSQYEAAESATGFLGTKITRDNILGAMQKLKKKWPTKRAHLCRSIKEYNCSDPSCNFKSTSPVAVKAHYGEFPLHAPPKKGRPLANAMTTDKLEEARIKKSVGKIATKPLAKLMINELRKLAGAMGLLDGGVGIGATKVEYTALIEAKREGNKRGITIITKRIAARNVAKKEAAANRLSPAGQAAEAAAKAVKKPQKKLRGRRFYKCQHPGCGFDAGQSSKKLKAHYDAHPDHRVDAKMKKPMKYHCHNPKCNFKATSGHGIAEHYVKGSCPRLSMLRHPGGNMPNVDRRRAEDPKGAKLVDARDAARAGLTKTKPKTGKYRCHNHSGGRYHGDKGVFTEACDFTATSGTGVRSHYVNGVCPKISGIDLGTEPDPLENMVQHHPEVAAEVTITKVDLDFCCNCQFDLTKHREEVTGDYAVNFCPKCSMPLPSFSS